MARASPPLLLPLLLLTLLAAVAVGPSRAAQAQALGRPAGGRVPRPTLAGGWFQIEDVRDAHIQELGGWALAEAQRTRLAAAGLLFRRVLRGEQQVVAGMNYRLVVDAAYPSGRGVPYVAVVFEQAWTHTRNLTSFKPAAAAAAPVPAPH
ncbi:hypothetical protein ACP4OV_005421 [Aristida adscensionis]